MTPMRWSRWKAWIVGAGVAFVALAVACLRVFFLGKAAGEARGRGKARQKGVFIAGEKGDVEELDDYWSGKR